MPTIARTLKEITSATADAILELHQQFHKSSTLPGTLVKIHELENQSDVVSIGRPFSTLFDEVADPIAIIKWKLSFTSGSSMQPTSVRRLRTLSTT